MKQFYIVGAIIKDRDVTIQGQGPFKLELTWTDGMVGVLPVFTNYKKAKKYAGDKLEVSTFTAMTMEKA